MIDSPMPGVIRLSGRVAVWAAQEQARARLSVVIRQAGYDAVTYSNLDDLRAGLTADDFSACVLDEPASPEIIRTLSSAVRIAGRPTQFVVLPSLGDRNGGWGSVGCDVLEPPCTSEKLARILFSAVGRSRLVAENLQLKRRLEGRMFDDLAGISPAMDEVRRQVQGAAEHDRPVLIHGEAGSGVSAVGRAIHTAKYGGRNPFLKICCSVLSSAVVEQELFGDVEHPGRFDSARGGTLLIEDVETLALPMQHQLANVLTSGQYRPVGSPTQKPLQVRVILTTHADLEQCAREGKLHPDLHRICQTQRIHVPALRDRLEDVGALAEQFLLECAVREGQVQKRLSAEALDRLRHHSWPGNVRQLANVVSRICALTTEVELTRSAVEPWLEQGSAEEPGDPGLTLAQMERKLIEATFNRYGGNRELTAKALSIGIRTLSGKLREYGYPPRGGPGSNRQSRAA
jgi:DNA-binding NtrC family response regulator